MFEKNFYSLTQENFSEVTAQIRSDLSKTKATEKEIQRVDLLIEETVIKMAEVGHSKNFQISIQKRFGDVNLKIVGEGEEFNPLIEVTDFDEEDENYFRTLILKANRSKMSYARKNNQNIVFIKVHDSANKQIYWTLAGMFCGIIFGFIFKSFASPEMISLFNDKIYSSVNTMFMNALNMMIAPVIFFSVISGITGLSNAADAGRIGGKLIGFYSFTTIVAIGVSIFVSTILFSNGVPQVALVEGQSTGNVQEISILSTIINIIPKNLINPIVNRELLQVIFVAIIFGICVNKLGDKVKLLNDFIIAANKFCITMITMIAEFIPLIAFFSIAKLVINTGAESLFLLGKLVLGVLGGCCIMTFLVYSTLLIVVGKISPLPFLKKLTSFIAIPFATSSSNVTMPFTMKFCTEKLGISPKLSSFSIPIGATVNMDGGSIFLGMSCIIFLKMYGIEIDANTLFTLFVSIYTISVGTPGIPGSGVVCVGVILAAFGIPLEATAMLFGIYPIIDRIDTCNNVVGDIAVTASLASNENLIDKKIYLN